MWTIYLNNRKPHHTLRYDGYDSSRCTHWVAYGSSYEELWKLLLDNGAKDVEDLYEHILLKSGKDKKKVSEFLYGIAANSDDEFNEYWDIIDNYVVTTEDSDEEYKDLIFTETNKTYYNSVTDLSEEEKEE